MSRSAAVSPTVDSAAREGITQPEEGRDHEEGEGHVMHASVHAGGTAAAAYGTGHFFSHFSNATFNNSFHGVGLEENSWYRIL